MKTKRQGKTVGPIIPLKKCLKCGELSVLTHSENRETWCSKCGDYVKGIK